MCVYLLVCAFVNFSVCVVPAESMRSMEKRCPSPLALDHLLISLLFVTRALMVHLQWSTRIQEKIRKESCRRLRRVKEVLGLVSGVRKQDTTHRSRDDIHVQEEAHTTKSKEQSTLNLK